MQTRRPFRSKLFQKHDCVISARTTAPRQKQTVMNKWKHVLILPLPCLFDNMASKVQYRFPLSFKRQSNLHFWPLFDEKLWISVLNGRSPTKAARNFQSITGSLLRRQYVVLLFNKLSLCPYMVRKPSISVIRTWQISCDIRKWPYLEVHCRFSFIACLAAILKSKAVLAVFSGNFKSLEETFDD